MVCMLLIIGVNSTSELSSKTNSGRGMADKDASVVAHTELSRINFLYTLGLLFGGLLFFIPKCSKKWSDIYCSLILKPLHRSPPKLLQKSKSMVVADDRFTLVWLLGCSLSPYVPRVCNNEVLFELFFTSIDIKISNKKQWLP